MNKVVAIITGASSGIGEAFVREVIAERGIYGSIPFQEIWLIARSADKLAKLVKDLGDDRLMVVEADLTEPEDINKIKDRLELDSPKVGLLINCAGMGKRALVLEKDEKVIEDTVDINCTSLSKLCRICIPYMIDPGAPYSRRNAPRIINIASSAAFLPQPGFAAYAASKAYVVNFSRALDMELMPYNIAVTTVCPGPVNTPFQLAATDGQTGEFTGLRRFFVADPVKLAKASLRAGKNGRHLYIYGISQKALHVISKIVPTYWILKLQQLMSGGKNAAEVEIKLPDNRPLPPAEQGKPNRQANAGDGEELKEVSVKEESGND